MVKTSIQLHSYVRAASFSIRQKQTKQGDVLGMPGDWALERGEPALGNMCQAAHLPEPQGFLPSLSKWAFYPAKAPTATNELGLKLPK